MAIQPITDGETGASVRGKLNAAISRAFLGFINVRDESGTDVTVISDNDYTDLNYSPAVKFVQNGLELDGLEVENTGAPKNVLLQGKVDLSAGPNNQIQIGFAKNGEAIPCSTATVTTPTGGRSENVVFFCTEALATGDKIKIVVRNLNSTNDITTEVINFFIQEI
jgi:hypothetical protein